jgi:hypothetical protein
LLWQGASGSRKRELAPALHKARGYLECGGVAAAFAGVAESQKSRRDAGATKGNSTIFGRGWSATSANREIGGHGAPGRSYSGRSKQRPYGMLLRQGASGSTKRE